jgi:NAD(P)-dependent dehydrogenase (short-subunit alcohol dehydrogenase family)
LCTCTTAAAPPRPRERLEAAGRRAIVNHTDIRNEHSVTKLFEGTKRKLGDSYILVNAGVGASGASVADTTPRNGKTFSKPIFMVLLLLP